MKDYSEKENYDEDLDFGENDVDGEFITEDAINLDPSAFSSGFNPVSEDLVCPKCGKTNRVLKIATFTTPKEIEIAKKYRGMCNGCLTDEERYEMFITLSREKQKKRLRLVK